MYHERELGYHQWYTCHSLRTTASGNQTTKIHFFRLHQPTEMHFIKGPEIHLPIVQIQFFIPSESEQFHLSPTSVPLGFFKQRQMSYNVKSSGDVRYHLL